MRDLVIPLLLLLLTVKFGLLLLPVLIGDLVGVFLVVANVAKCISALRVGRVSHASCQIVPIQKTLPLGIVCGPRLLREHRDLGACLCDVFVVGLVADALRVGASVAAGKPCRLPHGVLHCAFALVDVLVFIGLVERVGRCVVLERGAIVDLRKKIVCLLLRGVPLLDQLLVNFFCGFRHNVPLLCLTGLRGGLRSRPGFIGDLILLRNAALCAVCLRKPCRSC